MRLLDITAHLSLETNGSKQYYVTLNFPSDSGLELSEKIVGLSLEYERLGHGNPIIKIPELKEQPNTGDYAYTFGRHSDAANFAYEVSKLGLLERIGLCSPF